jgi:hypothetical protein
MPSLKKFFKLKTIKFKIEILLIHQVQMIKFKIECLFKVAIKIMLIKMNKIKLN